MHFTNIESRIQYDGPVYSREKASEIIMLPHIAPSRSRNLQLTANVPSTWMRKCVALIFLEMASLCRHSYMKNDVKIAQTSSPLPLLLRTYKSNNRTHSLHTKSVAATLRSCAHSQICLSKLNIIDNPSLIYTHCKFYQNQDIDDILWDTHQSSTSFTFIFYSNYEIEPILWFHVKF